MKSDGRENVYSMENERKSNESHIFFLAYTITAMHANFVLYLLSPPSPSSSSDQHQSTRTCLQSCGFCLRRFLRRFCFCLVLCVWSLSFTSTIPLLYTIDSNEKNPKPVYCPGTTQISYLEEWFDRNRLVQSVIFNLIPLLVTLFISLIALLKLFYDCLSYFYFRMKMSKCSPCRMKSSSTHHQNHRQSASIPHSISMLSSLGIISNTNNNNLSSAFSIVPMADSPTPTSEITLSSTDPSIPSCGHWCSGSFLRFLLVLSCCLLACIYPIAMRFYLVYFSVLVPLIFAVLNYSLGQLPSTQTSNHVTTAGTITTIPAERQNNLEQCGVTVTTTTAAAKNSNEINNSRFLSRNSPLKRTRTRSIEQFELQSPLMAHIVQENDDIDEREEILISPSISSQSSAIQTHTDIQQHRTPLTGKQKYFSNTLYEKYSRNMTLR